MCPKESDFYTAAGYRSKSHHLLTESMEDYLEMICRFSQTDGFVRINTLADALNVRPSSASKMAGHLKETGYILSLIHILVSVNESRLTE